MLWPDGSQSALLAPAGDNVVSATRLAPNRLLLDVQSEHGGLLLVSENWMPGWRAWLQNADGSREPLQVCRSNLTLLGLRVPAGDCSIELLYWPDSVRHGLIITSIAAASFLLVALWRLRQSKVFRR
jgi:uncharacterized membrane protein YfhO